MPASWIEGVVLTSNSIYAKFIIWILFYFFLSSWKAIEPSAGKWLPGNSWVSIWKGTCCSKAEECAGQPACKYVSVNRWSALWSNVPVVLFMNCVLIKCRIRKRMVALCHSWVLEMWEEGQWGQLGPHVQAGLPYCAKQLCAEGSARTHLAKLHPVVTLTTSPTNWDSHCFSLFPFENRTGALSPKVHYEYLIFPGGRMDLDGFLPPP